MRGMENPIKNDGVVTLFLYPTEREYPPLRKNIIFLFSKKDFFKKKDAGHPYVYFLQIMLTCKFRRFLFFKI